jgi:hypothetical protein
MVAATPVVDRGDLANARRMRVLLALLPNLAIFSFVLGLVFGVSGEDIELLGLAIVTVAVAAIPLILDQGRRPSERHILLSIFSLVYMAHFVTPVFAYYLPAFWPVDAPGMGGSNLTPVHVAHGQLVALSGLIAMLLSYASPVGRACSDALPTVRREWSAGATLLVACLMLGIGWAIQVAGGIGLLPPELGWGFLSTIGSSLIYGNVLLTYALLRYRSYAAFLILCITIPFTSVLGFFTGSKTAVLITPLVVALTVIVWRRRIRVRWIIVGVLAIALLYPTAIFFRQVVLSGNRLSAIDALRNPSETLERVSSFIETQRFGEYFNEGIQATGARLDGLGVTSVIVRDTPDLSPFQNGRTLALFFAAFVPRVLWVSKPEITIGQWITNVYGSGPGIESSTGPTQIGDFYLNFGIAGVIGGMVILGLTLRVTQESLLPEQPTAPGVLASVVILYGIVMRFEGNVAQIYSSVVFSLVPILVTHWIVRTLTAPPPGYTSDAAKQGSATFHAEV